MLGGTGRGAGDVGLLGGTKPTVSAQGSVSGPNILEFGLSKVPKDADLSTIEVGLLSPFLIEDRESEEPTWDEAPSFDFLLVEGALATSCITDGSVLGDALELAESR